MAIGERIRYFRRKRGLTQKKLGLLAGYPEKSADIRIAQYENSSRTPKQEALNDLAKTLAVSSRALNVPNIDNAEGLLHTLFVLEDLYGIRASAVEGEPFLFVEQTGNKDAAELHSMLLTWGEQFAKLENGEISREDYDRWRYCFPTAPVSAVKREEQESFNEKVGSFLKNKTKKSQE